MDATKELTAEHEGVRSALAILNGMLETLQARYGKTEE